MSDNYKCLDAMLDEGIEYLKEKNLLSETPRINTTT